ncbi:hypothetical protein [Pseudoduganella flava]|uniref:Uncharacterized protein n=1 Tax=Pseudoduganella flava TaxID=871742 RepID=A0ABX6FVC0_9BURK|nr:hypothetical protein [Pseudoduganella flava]QGZ41472.1 hypothetical protein GO485_22020 [Pseudoduganella flava]
MRIERDNTFSIAIFFCPLSRVVERQPARPAATLAGQQFFSLLFYTTIVCNLLSINADARNWRRDAPGWCADGRGVKCELQETWVVFLSSYMQMTS